MSEQRYARVSTLIVGTQQVVGKQGSSKTSLPSPSPFPSSGIARRSFCSAMRRRKPCSGRCLAVSSAQTSSRSRARAPRPNDLHCFPQHPREGAFSFINVVDVLLRLELGRHSCNSGWRWGGSLSSHLLHPGRLDHLIAPWAPLLRQSLPTCLHGSSRHTGWSPPLHLHHLLGHSSLLQRRQVLEPLVQ